MSDSLSYVVVVLRRVRRNVGRSDNHAPTKRTKKPTFFFTHFVGHRENGSIPSNRGREREPHTRIPRSGFNDGAMRLQQTLALGIVNHGDPDPILHATA